MILVDSSVWIDYFNGKKTPGTDMLDRLLGRELLAIGDIILTEVLQGFDGEREFTEARVLLTSLTVVELGGKKIAIQAAKNFRALRKMGVTIRKTIDTLIATWCIENEYRLLHNDKDFSPSPRILACVPWSECVPKMPACSCWTRSLRHPLQAPSRDRQRI